MTSIKPILREDKIKSNGLAPLYIRIIKDRKPRYKSLGINLNPKDWDSKKLTVKKSHPNSTRANNLIAKRIAEIQNKVLVLEEKEERYTGNNALETLDRKKSAGFLQHASRVIKRMESSSKIGTIDRTKAVVSKVKKYLEGSDILLPEITVGWLKDYEVYLRLELSNKTNTVGSNMKVIRKILNDAMGEELIDFGKNPFDRYKIPSEPTKIEYLTEDELKAFQGVQLTSGTRISQHRDLYVFACNAAGIRIGDLLKLQWKSFDGVSLKLYTSKGTEPLNIKLGRTALGILNKQKSERKPNQFLFGLLPSDTDLKNEKQVDTAISRVDAYVNKNLKIVAGKASIDKNIHFHTSRHTWATRALRKGMRIEHVSKLLGHRSLKTTMIYVKIVNADLDSAMDAIND
jgi:site-specific recombinase XerD